MLGLQKLKSTKDPIVKEEFHTNYKKFTLQPYEEK